MASDRWIPARASAAALTDGVIIAFLPFLGCCLSVSPHGGSTLAQLGLVLFALPILLLLYLAYSICRVDSGQTIGERMQHIRRIRTDGQPIRAPDWLRLKWPTLWLLGGSIVLLLAVGVFAPQQPTRALPNAELIALLQRRALIVGLVTILPPLIAWIARVQRGDGTMYIVTTWPPRRKYEPRGFDVIPTAPWDAEDVPSEDAPR